MSQPLVASAGLGAVPRHFDARERDCWREFVVDCPPWLLRRSDRAAAELLCRLYARSRRGWLKVGEEALLVRLLRCFGCTPAARAARWYRELEAQGQLAIIEREEAAVAAGEHAVRFSLTRGRARRRRSPS